LLIKILVLTQIVIKMEILKYILFVVLVTIFSSCSHRNVHEKHKVKIITLLINKFSAVSELPQKIPPRPLPLYDSSNKLQIKQVEQIVHETAYGTLQDSLEAIKHQKNLVAKTQIITVDSILITPSYELKNLGSSCKPFFELYQEFIKNNKKGVFKLTNIKLNRKQDRIVSFNKEEFNQDKSRFYLDHDIIFSFSNIDFNRDFTRAIVEMYMGDSRLSGFGEVFFLERINKKWVIVCSQGLFIS